MGQDRFQIQAFSLAHQKKLNYITGNLHKIYCANNTLFYY